MKSSIDYKNIYYPPGGILIWLLILLELLTFGIALISLVYNSKNNPQIFHESSALLNKPLSLFNTLLLLVSGYCMAISLSYFKKKNQKSASFFLLLTIIGGLCFLVVKGFEYQQKITSGYTLGYDSFFNYYWLLTGFHVIHVIVGLIILSFIYISLSKKNGTVLKLMDMEAGAAFWHMCDLIWLLLFPILYLIL